MKFLVRIWDCRAETDDVLRSLEFLTWASAIKYIRQLPSYEGGTIEIFNTKESK